MVLSNIELTRDELAFLLFYPVLAAGLSLLLSANYLLSVIIFLIIPSIYFSVKNQSAIKKTSYFAFILGIPGSFAVQYAAYTAGLWHEYSMFSYRLLGMIPLESFLWGFFYVYLPVIFYENFFVKKEKYKAFRPRLKYLAAVMSLMVLAVFLPSFEQVYGFNIYWQWGSLMFLLPLVYELLEFPEDGRHILEVGVYFFFYSAIYQITALTLNIWHFPNEDHFLAWIEFMGVGFPIEELIFWFGLLSIAGISMFEIFDDY